MKYQICWNINVVKIRSQGRYHQYHKAGLLEGEIRAVRRYIFQERDRKPGQVINQIVRKVKTYISLAKKTWKMMRIW